MPNTVLNAEYFSNMTQAFLRSQLVALGTANTRFEADITPGQQIHFPYASTVRVQNYAFSTDADVDSTVFTDDTLTVNQKKIATVNYDPMQNLQAHSESWQDMLAEEAAYQVARQMDQHYLSIGTAGAASVDTVGAQFTVANAYEIFGDADTTLARKRAGAGTKMAIVEPSVVNVLARADIANGFTAADAALNNGYVGNTNFGFRVYVSNELPCSVSLTLDTQPTDGDTVTVYDKTFTFKTTLGSTAGNVLIGASAATAQANLTAAIEGGAGAGSTYVDLSTDDRRELLNTGVDVSAFASDIATITGAGRIGATETFTAASNVFGTETCDMLFGHMGAVDFVAQQAPQVVERDETKNLSKNILITALYQAKVFTKNSNKLVKVTAQLD